jgi:lipoprotein-anchoring transpeptidase ErfK/SrfK
MVQRKSRRVLAATGAAVLMTVSAILVGGLPQTARADAPMNLLPKIDFQDPDLPDLVPIKGEEQLAKSLQRTPVFFRTTYPVGSIVIDTSERYLYYINKPNQALRYGIAVGKDGFQWEGLLKVSKKAQWPDWRPPPEMIARERKKGKMLPDVVKGGPGNPLGARAIYLGYSQYRIHGTNQPKSIGHAASSGCFRMLNEHVIDLYDRVKIGAWVVVRG